MSRTIAFLRAINVGGRTVKMAELCTLMESVGLRDVETFIASGNVIFRTPDVPEEALVQRIEAGLEAGLGYPVATFARSDAEVARIAATDAFGGSGPPPDGALNVGFLAAPPSPEAVDRLATVASEIDRFAVRGREVYWRCLRRQSESKVSGATLERALGAPLTLRGINTVARLAARYPPG